MLNKQYYVEKAKVDRLVARKRTQKQIFTTVFMTAMSIRC